MIVLAIAIAVGVNIAEQIPSWLWWALGLSVGGAIAILFMLAAYEQAKLRKDITAIQARADAEIASRRGSVATFYNDGMNKKKRKQIARRQASKQVAAKNPDDVGA